MAQCELSRREAGHQGTEPSAPLLGLSFYSIVGAHNKKECKAMILTCYLALLFLN